MPILYKVVLLSVTIPHVNEQSICLYSHPQLSYRLCMIWRTTADDDGIVYYRTMWNKCRVNRVIWVLISVLVKESRDFDVQKKMNKLVSAKIIREMLHLERHCLTYRIISPLIHRNIRNVLQNKRGFCFQIILNFLQVVNMEDVLNNAGVSCNL